MNKEQYHKYLSSRKWLLKKHKLISFYIKKNWHIRCIDCGSTNYLQVDHKTYDNVGKEKMDELQFMCRECHEWKHKGDPSILTERQWKFLAKFFKKPGNINKDNDWATCWFEKDYKHYLEKYT